MDRLSYFRASIEDPLRAFRYEIRIDGFLRAGFTECSGLVTTTEVINYREGTDPATPKKLPGLTDFDPITLKRGLLIGEENEMAAWYSEVYSATRQGRAFNFRRWMDIVVKSEDLSAAKIYRIVNAWPSKFTPLGTLGGQTNEAIIQEMEIQHEGFIELR